MTLEEQLSSYLLTIADNVPKVFESGITQGVAAKQAEVDANVYIGTFKGSGVKDMIEEKAIYMPILPDALCIFAFEPTVQRLANCWTVALYDRRSFADMVGTLRYFTINASTGVTNYGSGVQIASTAQNIYIFDTENKKMSFIAPSNSTYQKQVWDEETTYFVFAFRYAGDKTDKELLTETVANLVDGAGRTYTFSAHRINQTVTSDEWDALTATKPNSTFVLW